jgi:hypothetical protein
MAIKELKKVNKYETILIDYLGYTKNDCLFLSEDLKELVECYKVLKWYL